VSTFCSLLALTGLILSSQAQAGIVDFESFSDSEIIENQIPGVTVQNAIVLTAGISLNEFDFPPRSGVNVISDNGGPIEIVFSTSVLSFAGYFTYVVPLAIEAFDATDTSVALAQSLFSANDGFTGEAGSSPNELLQVAFAPGIARVVITGDALGSSFVLDDLTFEEGSEIPEPRFTFLILAGVLAGRALRNQFKVL